MQTNTLKIILNEKAIFLTPNHSTLIEEYGLSNAHILFEINPTTLSNAIDALLLSPHENTIIVGNVEDSLHCLQQLFPTIRAGGGLVLNSKNEYLFIFRKKKWDLPKGKLDAGESIEECAIREVKEETGIQDILLGHFITRTYHLYIEEKMLLKETTWFLMRSTDKYLTPQKEEGIQKAIWVHPNNLQFQLDNTFQSVKDLIQIVQELPKIL